MHLLSITSVLVLILVLLCSCHCFALQPMPCNVSLTDSCPAGLYYVPKQPKTIGDIASLFRVPSNVVNKTIDGGFVIRVTCSCPADHSTFVWHTPFTVQLGDTWSTISERFGSLVDEVPKKLLFATTNITLDFFCGCAKGLELVTYIVRPGDTLFTICSLFGADIDETTKLNKIANPKLINPGDKIFIPATGISDLIMLDDKDSSGKRSSKGESHIVLIIILAAAVLVLVPGTILFWFFHHRTRLQGKPETFPKESQNSKFPQNVPLHASEDILTNWLPSFKDSEGSTTSFKSIKATVFPYPEICNATSNFSASQKIGQGCYGCVYRGCLRGVDVAIKQMKNTKTKEFFAELNILCKVHHNNLIELFGYSAGAESLFLVYELAKNGALSDHLHNHVAKGHKPLSWSMRLRIALDAAKGLEYIHVHIKPFCVHRDVKTSNILLDSNFRAKIADFGLVKLLEHSPEVGAATSKIVGTFGYLAPEYVRDGHVTPKSDVYAYGVVLMELITGQPALTRSQSLESSQYFEHQSLVDTMLSALEDSHDMKAKLAAIVDPNLIDCHEDSLLQMALLSKRCVDHDWKRRPDMTQVVLRLSHIACSVRQDEIEVVHATH